MPDCLQHLTANSCFIYWDLFVIPSVVLKYSCAARSWNSLSIPCSGQYNGNSEQTNIDSIPIPSAGSANKSCAPSLRPGRSIFIVNIPILTILLVVWRQILKDCKSNDERNDFIETFISTISQQLSESHVEHRRIINLANVNGNVELHLSVILTYYRSSNSRVNSTWELSFFCQEEDRRIW